MKVVLFCGGLGLRLRDYADHIPKPMVAIGYRPIIWNVMKFYAHFGHRDFILCLGYRGDLIKQYFLNYDECLSNDFTFSKGGKSLQLANSDIHDWTITFADTGVRSNIGQRLLAVRKYVADEEVFLASYTDGLTDLDLSGYLDFARQRDRIATFVSVKPNLSYHIAAYRGRSRSNFQLSLKPAPCLEPRINSVAFAGARNIEKQYAILRGSLTQSIIEPCDDPCRCPGDKAIEATEQRFGYIEEGLLKDHPTANLACLSPKRPQLFNKSCDRLLNFGGRRRKRDGGNCFFRSERKQYGLGRKLMQGRSWIKKILPILPVSSTLYVDQQSSAQAGDPDRRQ